MDVTVLLEDGIKLAQVGKLEQAKIVLREVLKIKPDYPEAYVNLGLVAKNMNQLPEAEGYLRQALEFMPASPLIYNFLGVILMQKKQDVEAKEAFKKALALEPEYTNAYNNIGIIESEKGNLTAAMAAFSKAISLKPDNPVTYFNLGIVQLQQKLWQEAAASFQEAVFLNPQYTEAYFNLGFALQKEKLWHKATEALLAAIALKPDYAEAYCNLGVVLRQEKKFVLAEKYLRKAIYLQPSYANAHNNLAMVLEDTHCLQEAEASFRQAMIYEPDNAEVHSNLAVILRDLGKLEAAEKYFRQAIALQENFTNAEFGLACLQLLQGRYELGWKKYDDLQLKKLEYEELKIPRWQRESLQGKKILLFSDQGFGDTVQFIRYVPMVAKLAAETMLLIQKPLEKLVEVSQPACKIHKGKQVEAGEYDFACPLSGLPHMFATTVATIPSDIPYLYPCSAQVKKWRNLLKERIGTDSLRVGVVWAGNPTHNNDHNRSIPFNVFKKLLLALPALSWVSLQVGMKAADIKGKDISSYINIEDFSELLTDFSQTAALIANLDLVISVDSAVAHLAGAMGTEIWMLTPFNPDWRWQVEREDCLWYPSMRLFRQQHIDQWEDLLAKVQNELQTKCPAF